MNRFVATWTCRLALTSLVICGSGTSASAQVTAQDSAGVVILTNRRPVAQGSGTTWRLERVVSIGEEEGEEYQLHRVSDVARMADGSIVIANDGAPDLRIFDAEGRHLRTVGGAGDGPGEFRRIAGITLLEADSLLVFDPALGRATLFDRSGALASAEAMDATGDPRRRISLYRLLGRAPDGHAVLFARAFPADMMEVPTLHWDSVPTLIYTPGGELAGTIGEAAGMDIYATPQRAGDIHFARASSADLYGAHLYVTDGGNYEIRIYHVHDGLQRIVRWERDSRPVTDEDRMWLSETLLGRAPTDEMRRLMQVRLDDWVWADAKPWISRVIVDSGERLWVEEYQHPWRSSARQWRVFDRDGDLVGSVETPERFQLFTVSGSFLIGVWRDELDVEHVRVYHIVQDEGSGT